MISVRSNWPVSRRVDAEIGRELHRAAHALRHVDKRAVGEHRRIQRGEEIVGHRHDRAEIFPHQLGIVADRFRDRAEDHARFGQLRLEGRRDRNGVEHRIDRDAGQQLLLGQRNAELLVGLEQLRIDLIEALRALRLRLRRRVIIGVLIVDRRIMHARPFRLGHLLPALERVEPPFQHPFRLALLGRNEADRVFVQALSARSISMSVTKPYLYFSPARSATRSVVSRNAISFSYAATRSAPGHQAAQACDSRIDIFILARPAEAHAQTAARERFIDAHRGQHMRRPHLARRAGGAGRHRDAVEVERDQRGLGRKPGMAKFDVLGSRAARRPKITASGARRSSSASKRSRNDAKCCTSLKSAAS